MSTYEEQILRALRRITRASDLYSRQLASRFGLTGPQLVSLRALERKGPCTPGTLAKEVDLSQATMTGIVDRLEAAGLVRRTRDQADRRRITVTLTPAGQSLIDRAPSALQENLRDRLCQLESSEQASICATLESVVKMMGAQDLEPVEPAGVLPSDLSKVVPTTLSTAKE